MADFRQVQVSGLGSLGESRMQAAARRNRKRQASTSARGGNNGGRVITKRDAAPDAVALANELQAELATKQNLTPAMRSLATSLIRDLRNGITPAGKARTALATQRAREGQTMKPPALSKANVKQATVAAKALAAKGVPASQNVPGAIVKAQAKAVALRKEAVKLAVQVKPLMQAGNREDGGKLAIKVIQKMRDAAVIENKAAKTLAVGQLEAAAKLKVEQAKTIEQAVARDTAAFNGQGADAAKAQAGLLRSQANELKLRAAVVAKMPDVPASFPSDARIADVAAKFDARVQIRNRGPLTMAQISVLRGLDLGNEYDKTAVMESTDPTVVLGYYGDDAIGTIMRDVDLGMIHGAGLAGLGQIGLTAKGKAKVKGTKEYKAAKEEQAAFDAAAASITGPDAEGGVGTGGGILGWFRDNAMLVGGALAAVGAVAGGVWYWKKRKA